MSKYSNIKTLRLVSKRLIVDAAKRWERGKINIVTAGTGVGKTYNIMHSLIPSDIEEGYTKFLFLTVFTDNVDQDHDDMKEALFGKAVVTKDVSEFLEYSGDHPIVLVTTVSGAVNGGTDNENDQILINFLKNEKFVLYWDEAHFGGSSSSKAYKWNTSWEGKTYKASYYRFAEALALLENSKVFGFTATPLFEHKGLIPVISVQSQMYNLLMKKEDWATQEELTEITSQLRGIFTYNPDKGGFEAGIQLALNDYLSFSESRELEVKIINAHEPLLNLSPKTIMTLNAGMDRDNITSSLSLVDMVDVGKAYLDGKYDPYLFIFGVATEKGYMIGNLFGEWKKVKTFAEFTRMMKTSKIVTLSDGSVVDLRFVFHIEKFKFGLNIPNISHEVHSRERNQTGPNVVTVSILQIFGRAVRTYFGIEDLNVNFVSDAVDWLVDNYKASPVFNELREYMKLQNSHTFYVPNTKTYEVAIPEWKDDYSAPISMSQFNHVDRNGYKKTISSSKQERDAAYKLAQKDHCEREGCKCFEDFVTNPPISSEEFPLSEEERLVNYKKGLQVDHVDRNLNNLAPENLKTYCPNAHSGKTMKYEDYMPK
jgi:hypothetical protein